MATVAKKPRRASRQVWSTDTYLAAKQTINGPDVLPCLQPALLDDGNLLMTVPWASWQQLGVALARHAEPLTGETISASWHRVNRHTCMCHVRLGRYVECALLVPVKVLQKLPGNVRTLFLSPLASPPLTKGLYLKVPVVDGGESL